MPELVVPDNPKTGVTRACRYDPDLNPTYQQWALHYAVGVLPARPRKPRDKAKVECGVLVAGRWILAALRHRRFFSLTALNKSIHELLAQLNQRPFRKQPGSRASRFAELDQPAQRALPATRFEDDHWSHATVSIDYHVAVEHSFYGVPYTLVQKPVDVRATASTVEIFHRGERVASHVRSRLSPGTVRIIAVPVSEGKALRQDFQALRDRAQAASAKELTWAFGESQQIIVDLQK